MPIYEERQGRAITSRVINPDGSSVESSSSIIAYKMAIERPLTQKRPRPKDLFANGTARTVVSSRWAGLSPGCRVYRDPWTGQTQYIWEYPVWVQAVFDTPYLPIYSNSVINNMLLQKIKDEKVNLTVSIPELGKTTDMVSNLARDIWGTFRRLRSGRLVSDVIRDLASPKDRASKKLASRWLEYTYGWVPLMHDIYGLSEMISQEIIAGKYLYVRARKGFNLYTQQSTSEYSYVREGTGLVKGIARYKVDSTGLKALSQSGITNPLLTVWELVPYSFVIDWAVGIGDYLSTLDALVGINDLTVVRSNGYKATILLDEKGSATGWTYLARGRSAALIRCSTREAPTSDLRPRFPTYEPHMNTNRMISAVALLRNLFR